MMAISRTSLNSLFLHLAMPYINTMLIRGLLTIIILVTPVVVLIIITIVPRHAFSPVIIILETPAVVLINMIDYILKKIVDKHVRKRSHAERTQGWHTNENEKT